MILKRKAWLRVQKIKFEKEKKQIKAKVISEIFPKGERVTRKLYLKKLEDNPAFKNQLQNMKEILYGRGKKKW